VWYIGTNFGFWVRNAVVKQKTVIRKYVGEETVDFLEDITGGSISGCCPTDTAVRNILTFSRFLFIDCGLQRFVVHSMNAMSLKTHDFVK